MSDQNDQNTQKTARTIQGTVVSNKGHKSITVLIERRVNHPLYKKVVRRSTRVHAHDEENVCNEGDIVIVEACRPISKQKRWKLVEVVEQNKLALEA